MYALTAGVYIAIVVYVLVLCYKESVLWDCFYSCSLL